MINVKNAQPTVRHVIMRVPSLCAGLESKRILFVTDLHHGRWFSSAATRELVDRLNALAPDLILLGGDLADTLQDERGACACLARLRAPMGCVCVPGNNDHEAFAGDYAPFRAMLDDAGVTLLVNERKEWTMPGGRLVVSGLDDSKHGQPNRAMTSFARASGDFHIVLTHSPWSLDQALMEPQPDLVLCGHTHGGQIALGHLSMYTLGYERFRAPGRFYFFARGERVIGSARVIVSCGIGYSILPIRFGASPEVHLISIMSNLNKVSSAP